MRDTWISLTNCLLDKTRSAAAKVHLFESMGCAFFPFWQIKSSVCASWTQCGVCMLCSRVRAYHVTRVWKEISTVSAACLRRLQWQHFEVFMIMLPCVFLIHLMVINGLRVDIHSEYYWFNRWPVTDSGSLWWFGWSLLLFPDINPNSSKCCFCVKSSCAGFMILPKFKQQCFH